MTDLREACDRGRKMVSQRGLGGVEGMYLREGETYMSRVQTEVGAHQLDQHFRCYGGVIGVGPG